VAEAGERSEGVLWGQCKARRCAIEVVETETVELDAGRFIQLETYRQWPKLGVSWSVRQRSGESDFPLKSGVVDRLPKSGDTPEAVWADLRETALSAASEAANALPPAGSGRPKPSLLGRLFGRQ
jgi:hypothetical protein